MLNPKYKQYFNDMFSAHQKEMMEFMLLNNDYKSDKVKYSAEFHEKGKEIQNIVNVWLNKLCNTMEKGSYGAYSNKLADKFIEEVVKYFPCYHEIGVIVKK